MSDMFKQAKSEITQLPWMLGKLFGGIMAVVGVAGLVLIWTGKTGPLLSSLLPYFCSALLGFFLFLFCARAMARSEKECSVETEPALKQRRQSLVVWSLLFLFVLVFLLITYFVTR
jgi:hypothetical protein